MSELLPHEIGFLERAVSRGETENTQASIDMTSAIDDPNSWHDNAAYDEVIGRMTLIDARYAPVLRILREAEVIEYPDMDEEAVAIGSLVNIELNNKPRKRLKWHTPQEVYDWLAQNPDKQLDLAQVAFGSRI